MKAIYVYPGSFCPPTYGHVRLVERAVALFGKIFVVCSVNPDKENYWFSAEERVAMWKSYDLPENVEIETLESFSAKKFDHKNLVLVRGLRNEKDFDDEKQVIAINKKRFGIDNYFHILAEEEFKEISSSSARESAKKLKLEKLSKLVSPLVQSRLLEKVLEIENLFMVVGRPGSGKSTFLGKLCECFSDSEHINTDFFADELKPMLNNFFPGENLIQVAKYKEDQLKKVLARPWMEILKRELHNVRGKRNVFVEIPYGLQSDKSMFRFLGGKVIYFGCKNKIQNSTRVISRGTPEHLDFIDVIPGKKESKAIAKKHRLSLICIDTSGTIEELHALVKIFHHNLNQKGAISCAHTKDLLVCSKDLEPKETLNLLGKNWSIVMRNRIALTTR
jgi:pantetheine-phosphate adenylyltransferase